ncbi:MAG: TRAP transporter substrate-binding protein [Myxococcota bacterium]|nr:TRAP transporter substrate-binding protein [Myxococcota bacterium]
MRVLRLGHGLDSQHPVHLAMTSMREDLARRSSGALRLEVYPNEQLGSERECLELLQIGSLAMTKVSAAVLENFAPSFRVFGVPYLFRDDAHRFETLEGVIGREILNDLSRVRLRGLAWYDAGNRSFYTRQRPVRHPDDLAGLKIRVQESPSAIAMVRAMGGAATPIAWGELYTALQQGVVDGAENNPPSFHLSRHYEVSRFLSLDEHTAVPDVLLVSESVWQQLDADEREWLAGAAKASAQTQKTLWREATARALDAVRAAGVEIIRPDKQAFAQRAAGLQREPQIDSATAAWVARVRGVGAAGAGDTP